MLKLPLTPAFSPRESDTDETASLEGHFGYEKRISQALSLDESVDSGIWSPGPSSISSPTATPTPTPGSQLASPKALKPKAPRWLSSVQFWILVWFSYIRIGLQRLSEAILRQASLNRKKARQHVLEQSFEGDGTAFFRNGAWIKPKYGKVVTIKRKKEEREEAVPALLPRPMPPLSPDVGEELELLEAFQTTDSLLREATETKIVTSVFEISGAGLGELMADLEEELHLWFVEQGSLVVCSEMVWSVPSRHRDYRMETQMKDRILRALRANNKKILDLRFSPDVRYPVCLPEATTEESSGKERYLDTFQGIYRRYYTGLLPAGHKDTTRVHAPYWSLNRTELKPNPEKFLMGNNRRVEELRNSCLVALNIVGLKF